VYRLLKNLERYVLLPLALAVWSVGICVGQTPDAAAANSKVIATKLSGFGVPFKINSEDTTYIEVQLYLSEDLGKTWTFYGRKNTDESEFRFEAEADGEYWFSLKTLSRDRRLLPEGDPQPELKILVDTVKPQLNVRMEADPAGRVICRWQATDKNLNVAVEIADSAGNSVRQTRRVNLPATAWRTRSTATALPDLAKTNQQTALKPAATGAGSNALPNQPDWAYPGWKSPRELRQDSGKSNPPIGPNPTVNSSGSDKTAGHGSGKPNGVICENGVCRLAPKQDMPSRVQPPTPPTPPPCCR